jgi:hypothetical protein
MPKIVDFNKLEQIYSAIMAVDAEDEAFRKALRFVSKENVYCGSDNVRKLEELAYSLALGGDELLVVDFEYLVYEVPAMDGGGSIKADGKEYKIRDFADLRHCWTETGAAVDG